MVFKLRYYGSVKYYFKIEQCKLFIYYVLGFCGLGIWIGYNEEFFFLNCYVIVFVVFNGGGLDLIEGFFIYMLVVDFDCSLSFKLQLMVGTFIYFLFMQYGVFIYYYSSILMLSVLKERKLGRNCIVFFL